MTARLRTWMCSALDRQIGDEQQEQDDECCSTHGPSVSYAPDQVTDHDRKDNTANTRARR